MGADMHMRHVMALGPDCRNDSQGYEQDYYDFLHLLV